MSIRSKVAVLLCAVVGLLVTLLALVFARGSLDRLEAIEATLIIDDLARTELQIESDLVTMSGTNADWAYWDDAHDFVLNGTPEFAEDNLSGAPFLPLAIDHVAFVAHDGTVRFVASYDEEGNPIDEPAELVSRLRPDGLLGAVPPERGALTGVTDLNGELVLFSVREVFPSSNDDPAAGVMFVGRRVTSELVDQIGTLTGREVELASCLLVPCDGVRSGEVLRSDRTVATESLFVGPDGQPLAKLSVGTNRELYQAGVADVGRVLGITASVGLLAIVGGSLLVRVTITRRLERLTDRTLAIGRTGHRADRVEVQGADEIGQLAGGINKMLDTLETATAEIDETRREVEAASEAKSRFLSRLSHELRNPLNGISAHAQLLQLERLSGDQGQSVTSILLAAGHISSMMEEFLDAARIEAGTIPLSPAPTALRGVVLEAIGLTAPIAGQRGIEIGAAGDDAIAQVDRTRLRQVLLNLLSNAVKYNADGGRIDVRITAGAMATISVTDTGAGIAPEDLDRVFVPFDRLGADARTTGTGIGLPVSKQLVELMGGSIVVESRPGVGTRFSVRLPSAGEPGPAGPTPTLESPHRPLVASASPR